VLVGAAVVSEESGVEPVESLDEVESPAAVVSVESLEEVAPVVAVVGSAVVAGAVVEVEGGASSGGDERTPSS
jgi:hypothetical protein